MRRVFSVCLIIILSIGITACNKDSGKSEGLRPPLLMYKGVIYQTTGETEQLTDEFVFVGEIQEKIPDNSLPTEELTSNMMEKGTKVYTKNSVSNYIYVVYEGKEDVTKFMVSK